jgi:hypothetical protein
MLRQEPKPLQRVDAMFLERLRQIHIGPYLVYPALGVVPNNTIEYTAASDSYSTLVTAHFPSQECERKLVQVTKVRESTLHILSWKEQKITREQLELKAQSGSIKDWEAERRRKARRYSQGSYLCCMSVLSNALRVNDGPRVGQRTSGAEAAFRGLWEDYLGFQVGEVR